MKIAYMPNQQALLKRLLEIKDALTALNCGGNVYIYKDDYPSDKKIITLDQEERELLFTYFSKKLKEIQKELL